MTQTSPETTGWQLEEDSASAYERYLVRILMNAWARDLVERVELAAGERVADVACGTGIVGRWAAQRVGADGAITGVDINPAMLEVARSRSAGIEPEIRWEQAPAEQLPLPDGDFDVGLCQQGLQFFTDRPAAVAELFRIIKPGGRLGLNTCRDLAHQPGYTILVDTVRRHVGNDAADVLRSPYALGDAEEVRRLVEGAGFSDVRVRIAVWSAAFPSAEGLLRAETASSPLGEIVGRLDADTHDALVADLTGRLGPYTDDEQLIFPFQTLVVTAAR